MFTCARFISALLAGAALAFAPPAADAQTPIRVGLGGGISMPVGDIAKTSSSGINLVASLTYEPRRPCRVRGQRGLPQLCARRQGQR